MRSLRLSFVLVVLALALSEGALAKCDPAAGWPAGKQCQDAERVGVRINGADKSLQAALDDGSLPSTIQAGAAPQTVTLANLPTCNAAAEGIRRIVSDALSDLACTTGGGSANAPVVCRNAAWACEITSAAGGSSIATATDVRDWPSSGAIYPNPYSTLVVDTKVFFIGAKGGNHDDDGSLYSGTPTANAVGDFINSSNIVEINATASPYTLTITTANEADLQLCRDSSTFAPCSTGGTCSTNVQPNSTDGPIPYVLKDDSTGRYEPVAVSVYTGCNFAGGVIDIANARRNVSVAGSLQMAMPDGTHGGTYYNALLAQTILGATLEFLLYPAADGANLIANGHATSNVTGWDEVGAATLTLDAAETIPKGAGGGNFNQAAAALTGRTVAADSLRTPAMAVEAGRWYVAKGYARNNDIGSQHLIARAVDASSNTPHPTQATYIVRGASYDALTSSTTSKDRECLAGCFLIVKFQVPAGTTSTRIEFATDSGTATINADGWVAFPAPSNRLSLTPLFNPGGGGASIRVEGDSRANDANDLADAIDDAIAAGVPVANFRLLSNVFPDNTTASGGRTATGVVSTEVFSSIRTSTPPSYTIVQLGVNDVGGRTPSQIAADYQAIAREIRMRGSRPILILEAPYRGFTNTTTCAGSANCGTNLELLSDLMLHSATGALHQ